MLLLLLLLLLASACAVLLTDGIHAVSLLCARVVRVRGDGAGQMSEA